MSHETREEIETRWLTADSVKERKAIARELQSYDLAHESGELKKDPDLWIATTPSTTPAMPDGWDNNDPLF